MPKVMQLGAGAINVVAQYLVELPGSLGTGCGHDWAGRKQLNTLDVPRTTTHNDMSYVSHDDSQNRSYTAAHFTDETLRLKERKNRKGCSVLTYKSPSEGN